MHPVQMTKKVRVRCGRVLDGNVSVIDGYDGSASSGSRAAPERRARWRAVGGFPVAVDGRDPNERRMTHRRSRQVAQRIVIRPFPLHAAESEALGGQPAFEAVGPRAPGAAQLLVLLEVEPDVRISGIELERCQPERGEVSGLVDLDQGSRRLVHQIDREQQVLSRRVEDRDVAVEAGVDRAELLDRRGDRPDERRIAPRLRDSLEPHVALFAQASRTTRLARARSRPRPPPARKPAERRQAPPADASHGDPP